MSATPAARAALAAALLASPRQLAASISLVLVLLAWGLANNAWQWLGLFGAMLFPLCASALLMQSAARWPPLVADWRRAWLMVALALLASCALTVLLYGLWMAAHGLRGMDRRQLAVSALGFASLVIGLPIWQAQSQERVLRLAQLERAALASDLKALQAQIEPHFLYNTLANTRYLARTDPARAEQMLDHLIGYLRGALPDLRAPVSTLGRECELARHYLGLMSVRFGGRLQYTVDVPEPLLAMPVPPLMVMTLVENAVRHGLEPQPGTVHIALHAVCDGDLRISVSDDGAGIGNTVAGSGVGLANLRQRLSALYGEAASFVLQAREEGGVEATLRLPMGAIA